MSDVYKDFQREPSRAHQCMHESEKDGTRCRAMAMQNNYMCYAHRTDDIVTVIENDMFLIDDLSTHEAIQKAFVDVAARLACNHIDLKRAELLITLLRAASRNLREAGIARRHALREAAAEAKAANQETEDLDMVEYAPNGEIISRPQAAAAAAIRTLPSIDASAATGNRMRGRMRMRVPRPSSARAARELPQAISAANL